MAAFESIKDISGFKSGEQFYIDKYDSTSYDNIEKTLDEILENKDNDVIKEYITKYIPEEEQNITYNFKCSTNTIIQLNNRFIASQNADAPPPDGDDDKFKAITIEKTLFNSIKNYSAIAEKKNDEYKKRYIILQEKILKNEIRRNLQKQQQSMFAFLNRMTYLGVISGVSVFCVKLVLISNLTNPAVWIGFLSKIYANPLYFQYFIDIVSTLNIFTTSEIITLKDMFLRLQILIKDNALFKNTKYVDILVKCIFNPTPENRKILQELGLNPDFKDHENSPQLMQFFSYIKSVTDSKNVFKESTRPSEKKPIWKKNLLNELFTFYTSPLGNTALTSLKLATDAYGYFSQSVDFFTKHKDANPALLLKGITLNSVNSYSFNVYSRIFTQNLLNKITGSKDSTLILDIPIFGSLDVNTFFVTTVDSFLNIQTKSMLTGYFTRLEQEVGYDPEKEKREKEKEKKNSIEGIREDIIKRGTIIKKYEGYGYSNEQIAKLINKPDRPNNYKFFLSRYLKTFYNTFLDMLDDPFVAIEIFTNVSFIFNIIQNNFYSILMSGGVYFLPQMVLTGFAHRSYLNLGSLTGNILTFDIVPIKIITAYFRFKYGSDIVINRQFELLKYQLINDIFSDIQTLFNEMQGLFFDTSLGMSINRYLEQLNDTIIGRLFQMSCKITYLFVNFAVLPTVKNKIVNLLPNIKFPIIETLEDREKSERLFTFIDNKISNLVKASVNNFNNNMDIAELFKVISKDFGEFIDISKIIEGTIIPYINANGFFEWSGKMKSPLEGSVIKFVKKPAILSNSVDDKLTAYAGDILSESKQEESLVTDVKIVLGTDDSGYGNFKVVDTSEIKSLLTKIYDEDARFDPRNKDSKWSEGIADILEQMFDRESYKQRLLNLGFTDEKDIQTLMDNGITYDQVNKIMNEVEPKTGLKPTVQQVMASILATNSLRYKTGTAGKIASFLLGDTGNVIKDFSMSNIYYYYYYKLFINKQLADKKEEFKRKTKEKQQKEEAEIKLLVVGSKIMYNNKPATIKNKNSDGTFDIEDNEGNIILSVNKIDISPQVGNLRNLSKKEEQEKEDKEFKELIDADEKKLSKQDDFDKFAVYLQNKFNIIDLKKRNGESYSIYEHAILTDMLTSLKTRESIVTHNIIYDNRGDVVKSILINDKGIEYLDEFFKRLYSGAYDNPSNPNIKLKTEILDKSKLVRTEDYNAYFGINLQHSYGFSPQVVDSSKFLNSIEMLISLNSDSPQVNSLSNMIVDLESRAATNINIQQSLDKLNDIYTTPIADITSYYKKFIEYFKSAFCNDENCNKENLIVFKHMNFNYNSFYEKMKETLEKNRSDIFKNLNKMIENPYIINFLKNNSQITYVCNLNGKVLYLNKKYIDMNTGVLMSESECVNISREIDFSNKDEVLQIILRPETIFGLSKISDLPKEAYDELKKSSIGSVFEKFLPNKENLNEYDNFFKLFNGLGKDGIKSTTEGENIQIFNILSDVIDEQEKELASKMDTMDPIEKYKLRLLFNFNKILKSQMKGYVDPQIKKAYINYFTQKDDILDNEGFLNNQVQLEGLFEKDFFDACKNDKIKAKEILQQIKKDYFDKDVIGSINLNNHILRISDINFQDLNSAALNNKLNDYVKYQNEEFLKQKNSLEILLKNNKDKPDLGELCSDGALELIDTYINLRKTLYDKQAELFKLYILHNSDRFFDDLSNKYDKFTDNIQKVIEDYQRNLSIIWSSIMAKGVDVVPPSPELSRLAAKLEREKEVSAADTQAKQQKIQDIAGQKEKTELGETLAKPSVAEKTGLKTDTTKSLTESTEIKTEESLDLNLQYGTSTNPNYFGNLVDSLVKVSPSNIYTDTFKPMAPIDTKLETTLENKNLLTTPSAECNRNSPNWYVEYDNAEQGYAIKTQGDLTTNELNSYGCQTTNLMHDIALNVNSLIIHSSKAIIGILQSIQMIIKSVYPPIYPYVAALIKMAQVYSTCYIYIFHSVMHKKFSEPQMINKLTSGEANLSDKLMFGLWTQMVTTLKEAEGNKSRNDDLTCNNSIMQGIIGQDINNIETNAYYLIDAIASADTVLYNPNMNDNVKPSENNLPGYIDTGLIDLDGINYSNNAWVAFGATATFLNEEELKFYDTLIKKPSISCSDFNGLNRITALKLSIFSLIRNPTNNFFYKNLNCRLFGTEQSDLNNKKQFSALNFIRIIFFTNWKELIEDFMTIMFTNKALKPFFLTKLFGNKSQGRKKNFIRDLIDDSFLKAELMWTKKNEKGEEVFNQSSYETYLRTNVSGSIYEFILSIITSFFGVIYDLDVKVNGGWIGINPSLYQQFRNCKGGACTFSEVERVTKDAIIDLQNVLASINSKYKFDTTQDINLESEANKTIINSIVNSENYKDVIENLKLNDTNITNNPELSAKWETVIYNQYKEILSFYKEYSEYNTAIVKHVSDNLKKNDNVEFKYIVANYNYRNQGITNKIKSFSGNYLIKPCSEGQILYFFNKDGVVSFNCLDFNDTDTKKFETQLQINDDLFKKDYEKYAKTALNDNIKVLDVFINSKKVICDNAEYCSGISTDYSDFFTQNNKKFEELLTEETPNNGAMEEFQKTFFKELGGELEKLLSLYSNKEKIILESIRDEDAKLQRLNNELKDPSLDENTRIIKQLEIDAVNNERDNLTNKLDYFRFLIKRITDSDTGLLKNVKEVKAIGSISTPEVITQEFIISELNKDDIKPDYFAYLYCKFFSLSEDNPDILNLFEFFKSNDKNITDLESKMTNNKYYFNPELYNNINTKLLENSEIKNAILENLKIFLSKNQKEQYLYTGNKATGYYIKDEEGKRTEISNGITTPGEGFQIVKDNFKKIKPHDLGIEETEADLAQIQALKDKLVKRREREINKSKELDAKAEESTKTLLIKMEAREAKKLSIKAKLKEINDEDEKYYEKYKEYYQKQKYAEEEEKKAVDKKQAEYDTKLEQFNILVKSQNKNFYENQIEPYLKKVKQNKEDFDKLDKELNAYMSALQQKAETDYNKMREKAGNEAYELAGNISEYEKNMMNEGITDNEYDKLFEQWESALKQINKYDNFLMKSYENQKFDIEMLKSQYYNDNVPIEGFGSSDNIINKKKMYKDLLSETAAIPVYVKTLWEKFSAFLSTGINSILRWIKLGGVNEDDQKKYDKAQKDVNYAFAQLEEEKKKYSQIKDSVLNLEKILNNYIEPLLHEEKRGIIDYFVIKEDAFLSQAWILQSNNNNEKIEFDVLNHAGKMNSLRAELDGLKNNLKEMDNEIAEDEAKISDEQRDIIKEKQKLIDDINNRVIKIEEREKQLQADIIKRKKAYEKLLIDQENTDKLQLADFNHKFGYSIKIDDNNGQISLQKTFNSFATSNEEELLGLFKSRDSASSSFKYAYGKAGILFTTIPTEKKNLGKDSNGKEFPLNDNKKLLDDKVKDGFPPIIFGKDVQDIMALEDGDDVNIFEQKRFYGFISTPKNLEVLSKKKIKKYINEHYEKIGEGDSTTYVMKTQIKMWEGTFINFSFEEFKKAFAIAMREKQENVGKFKDYKWTPKYRNTALADITPTPEQIDNVFGVRFDYFDNLKIRGVDESHPEQQSINAIKGNRIKEGKDTDQMVDGVLLPILPLNIYQSSLNNYVFDYENDNFEMFIPGKIELIR
jgi:hypothetical protein